MMPAWVASVKPEAKAVDYTDEEARGLVLRAEVSGLKTWVLRYTFAGRGRRYRLGTFPAMTLAKARAAALRMAGSAFAGSDPQLERERRRVGEGVATAVDAWLADEKQGPTARWKGGLKGGSARSFLPHIRRFRRDLGPRRLSELTAKDVERFISAPEAAATRNRALTSLRQLFAWAIRKGLTEADPTAALTKERETERARVLTDAELRALVLGFDGTRHGRAVRLLALTGLRRDEVLGARWSWLDADAGVLTIPPEAEKTGRARGELRRVALSPQAVALLADQRAAQFAAGIRSSYVFGGRSCSAECKPGCDGHRPHADALKPNLYTLRGRPSNGRPASTSKRAKARAAVLPEDVTIHDVRRTVGDALLNRIKAAPWVVDHVVLGHVRPKLLRTYMPTLPLDEARAALTSWAEELERIVVAPQRAEDRR
jgi:integrase